MISVRTVTLRRKHLDCLGEATLPWDERLRRAELPDGPASEFACRVARQHCSIANRRAGIYNAPSTVCPLENFLGSDDGQSSPAR